MKFNAANAKKVIDWIEENPEGWDQTAWPDDFREPGCFFCIAERIAGLIDGNICDWMGVNIRQFSYLSADRRTLPELKERIRLLAMEANGHE